MNTNFLNFIKRLLDQNLRDWHSQLRFSLWVDRTRAKRSLGTSPYHLVYGQDPDFPIQLRIPKLRFMQEYLDPDDRVQIRLLQLLLLEEQRDQALEKFAKHQGVVKWWIDRCATINSFKIFHLVLYWDKAHNQTGDHDKFDNLWKGPYQIYEILGENAIRLKTLTGEDIPLPANGQFLKHYFRPWVPWWSLLVHS